MAQNKQIKTVRIIIRTHASKQSIQPKKIVDME